MDTTAKKKEGNVLAKNAVASNLPFHAVPRETESLCPPPPAPLTRTCIFRAVRRRLGYHSATRMLLPEADPAPVSPRTPVAARPVKSCNMQNRAGGGGVIP